MKHFALITALFFSFAAKAQKVDSIYFNLYTDSLKKGVYNYINVDGKLDNGRFFPLMSDEVSFTSSAGKWEGNSLIIDSGKVDSVIITASLRQRPEIKKTITVYVKRLMFDPPLKSEKELLEQWRKKGRSK